MSTIRRQSVLSLAFLQAEWIPMLTECASVSIALSQLVLGSGSLPGSSLIDAQAAWSTTRHDLLARSVSRSAIDRVEPRRQFAAEGETISWPIRFRLEHDIIYLSFFIPPVPSKHDNPTRFLICRTGLLPPIEIRVRATADDGRQFAADCRRRRRRRRYYLPSPAANGGAAAASIASVFIRARVPPCRRVIALQPVPQSSASERSLDA